ncbi:MAG: hypothetical protein ACEY3M_19865 [Wolbachia sp.]
MLVFWVDGLPNVSIHMRVWQDRQQYLEEEEVSGFQQVLESEVM